MLLIPFGAAEGEGNKLRGRGMDAEAASVEQGRESEALANFSREPEELSASLGRQGRSKRGLLLIPSWSGVGRSSTTLGRWYSGYHGCQLKVTN